MLARSCMPTAGPATYSAPGAEVDIITAMVRDPELLAAVEQCARHPRIPRR